MRCYVKNCKNNDRSTPNKSFFKFPKDEPSIKKWLKICEQKKPFNNRSWRVCSDHFHAKDIDGNLKYEMGFSGKRFIKPGAVPVPISQSQRNKRMERREMKRIVERLLSQHGTESAETLDDPSTSTCNHKGKKFPKREVEFIAVPRWAKPKEENEENINPIDVSVNAQIKTLQENLKKLGQENRRLRSILWHKERKYKYQISSLKSQIVNLQFQCRNADA